MAYARQQYDKMVSEKKAAGERVPFCEAYPEMHRHEASFRP